MRADHRVRWLLLLVAFSAVSVARAQDDTIATALSTAQAAYERGDFEEAAVEYQAALDAGADDSRVHYNLGNAHFKQGELGRAIASYVRAQRLAPRDPRIATNLERARAQIRDRELSGGTVPAVLRPVPWLYGRLALNEWIGLALAAWTLFVLVLVAGHWRPEFRARNRPIGGGLLALTLLAGVMGGLHYRNEVLTPSAVAVQDEIEVRSGPGRDYPLAFRIHEGLQVDLAEERPAWVRIDLGGELTGWVPAGSLERL